MDIDTFTSTASAALDARNRLAKLATAPGTGVDEARMAKVAHAAIFEEALLGELHSRINELRSVAK